MFVRLLSLALVLLSVEAGAGLPTIKAEVAEPVVEELMGGCSLKCVFAWQVEVQLPDRKSSFPKPLNDSSAFTAWFAPEGTTGVGTRFRFLMPKHLRPEMEGQVPLYGVDVVNGNWKEEGAWKDWARLKRVRLSYNERPFCEVAFADSRRWAKIPLEDIPVHSGDVLTMEVLEIYPGKKSGLAISEFVMQGAH